MHTHDGGRQAVPQRPGDGNPGILVVQCPREREAEGVYCLSAHYRDRPVWTVSDHSGSRIVFAAQDGRWYVGGDRSEEQGWVRSETAHPAHPDQVTAWQLRTGTTWATDPSIAILAVADVDSLLNISIDSIPFLSGWYTKAGPSAWTYAGHAITDRRGHWVISDVQSTVVLCATTAPHDGRRPSSGMEWVLLSSGVERRERLRIDDAGEKKKKARTLKAEAARMLDEAEALEREADAQLLERDREAAERERYLQDMRQKAIAEDAASALWNAKIALNQATMARSAEPQASEADRGGAAHPPASAPFHKRNASETPRPSSPPPPIPHPYPPQPTQFTPKPAARVPRSASPAFDAGAGPPRLSPPPSPSPPLLAAAARRPRPPPPPLPSFYDPAPGGGGGAPPSSKNSENSSDSVFSASVSGGGGTGCLGRPRKQYPAPSASPACDNLSSCGTDWSRTSVIFGVQISAPSTPVLCGQYYPCPRFPQRLRCREFFVYDNSGYWAVGTEDDIAGGVGWLATIQRHDGRPPDHSALDWRKWMGHDWEPDTSVQITRCRKEVAQ
ncbi:hypothetical protein DIPPA_20896 [Diplonema papillatum]|nr:hypothetical protein DIPPA_20896 [Diplonema papillatum]